MYVRLDYLDLRLFSMVGHLSLVASALLRPCDWGGLGVASRRFAVMQTGFAMLEVSQALERLRVLNSIPYMCRRLAILLKLPPP